jgi:hypothetical protein
MTTRLNKSVSPHPVARATICTSVLAAAGLAGLLVSPSTRAADVGVSISVSQPGVYGRIDIGRFPAPDLIVAQPVIVQQPRVVVARPQPVYLWVPPGHQKHWSKHCHRYSACGTPVYFVKEEWYRKHVSPARPVYSRDDDHDHDHGHGHGRGRGKGHD